MSRARTVVASERTRRPDVGGAAHPQLRALLARDYAGYADAPPHPDIVAPATAAICVVLILNDPPRFSPEVLSGAHDTVWLPGGACPTDYVELWLAPLGAYRLLGMPVNVLSGQVVDMTDVLGADSRRLADQIRDTPSWEQRFKLLDEYLLRRAQHGPDPAPEVVWAWRRLLTTGGKVPIGQLASEVGWSHKHLITRFNQQIGLPPKTAARIVRFDEVWRRLTTDPPARWDEIAVDSGYCDQAHLIRDSHQFTGTSPTAFLAHPTPAQPAHGPAQQPLLKLANLSR